MPLPDDFTVPTRAELVDRYERDVRIRQPGAKVGEGTLARMDASNTVDLVLPVYADAVITYQNTTLADARESSLEDKAEARGLPRRLPASGATGFVIIKAVSGGVPLPYGKIIKDDKASLSFYVTSGQTYFDGDPVPIKGVDVGPSTNLAAGKVLRWESPTPGLAETATILADPNGRGLSGGRDKESVDELRARIADADANPAAAANAAEIRKLAKDAATARGIAMQDVFVYSAAEGPNTYAYCFTMRADTLAGSRAPSAVDIAAVRAYLTGELGHGDGIFDSLVIDSDVTLMLRVKWAPGAGGWKDLATYPQWDAGAPAAISAVTSALAFQVTSTDTPQVGQTIAFYDAAANPPAFVRKKILTVTGAGPFDLTIDTALNASDTVYLPIVGETFCPWSDSLTILVAPVLDHFKTLGPGEQFEDADLFDPGERLRRNPPPPQWPNELTHRVTDGIEDETAIADVSVLSPALPYATPVGTPAVSSNLLKCARILAFP